VQKISVLYHVQVLARPSEDVGGALIALALLTAIWLGVGWWRLGRIELGSAEG
jgi:hypothetical protein